MDQLDELKERYFKGVRISTELLDLLQMTQDKGNGYLDSHVDAVTDVIFHIASKETVVDDEKSKSDRFVLIKELSSVREMLQKLGRTALIAIFALLEPEILSNLCELGDIYIY
ncbi:MAG: hypothetical protein WCJ95_22470 [Mariniphaga sp.]